MKFLLLFTALLISYSGQACDDGFVSFQNSVFLKVRKDCAKCHDGSHIAAPAFAVADPMVSYQSLLSYMNFNKIEESMLVIRAGNSHCQIDNCDEASGAEMMKMAQMWWDGGEKACLRNGKYFTEEMPIPANLPGINAGFTTMSFDLGVVDPSLAGIRFEIGIQNYSDPGIGTRGAYRLRAPRLTNGQDSLYVKDVKILLNGKYDPIFNTFTTVDKSASFVPVSFNGTNRASPVLSAQSLILLKDGLDNPKLSVSFAEIKKAVAMACVNSAKFANVSKVFQQLACVNCHKGGQDLGTQVLNMTADANQLCRISSELIADPFAMTSPLVSYPKNGSYNHPQLAADQSTTYVKALRDWIGN